MRKLILLAAAALVVSAAFVDSAWAVQRPIGFVTSQWLKKACGKAGGDFSDSGSGYYVCFKACKAKSGKTDLCSVQCDSNKQTCKGTTPDRTAGGTIQQILNAGTYSDRRNPKTMINNAGTFTQPTPQNRMINTSGSFAQQPAPNPLINGAGTFQSRPPATVGVPTSGSPNFAMPRAPSQPTLNMQRR